uniref:Uncharacterized protein n=1 Tax=Gopherus agassizii TaxID=38772 RepID=A0A452IDL0_9SAUR
RRSPPRDPRGACAASSSSSSPFPEPPARGCGRDHEPGEGFLAPGAQRGAGPERQTLREAEGGGAGDREDSGLYLKELIEPVLTCFNDADSRLRYYACEALYNIVKVARGSVLPHFNVLFDGLSKLAADPDPNVKSGSELLDRLLKVIPISLLLADSPRDPCQKAPE